MTDLKKKIEKILHPEVEKLHPPMAPKFTDTRPYPDKWKQESMPSEKELYSVKAASGCARESSGEGFDSQADSKPDIDFKAYWEASEFQRFIYWIRYGKVFRGSNEALEKEMWKSQKDMELVQDLKRIDPNARNFGDVMKEFKEKVKRLREK